MNINFFMSKTILEAKKAFNNNEVPVGGLIVDNKTKSILVRGYNEINNSNCAINHCEISLINNACKKLNSKYLINTTLFISLEPCIMCAAAISEVHISKVYFGAYSINNDGLEKYLITFKKKNLFIPEVYGGFYEKESLELLKKFFENQRT